MVPKETRFSADEAKYIIQQFDYIWGTYTVGTDSTSAISHNESIRRAAVVASGVQLQTFRSRFAIIVDRSTTMTSVGPLSSFSGGGGAGNRAAAPGEGAKTDAVPSAVPSGVPTVTPAAADTPGPAGSSDDHLPKPVTAADRKSPKPTMSPKMKDAIKVM